MAVNYSTTTSKGDILSTELNSLANDAYTAVGTEVDNATDQNLFADFELDVTYGTAPDANSVCSLYLIPAVDGTNYADGGGSVAPPANTFVGNFQLRAVTTAQKIALTRIAIPNAKFKPVVLNGAGQAMAASGNTLACYVYTVEDV